MEYIKFNAIDMDNKLVYCAYRSFTTLEKGEMIQKSFPYDAFIAVEPKVAKLMEGLVYSIYLEQPKNYDEKKSMDGSITGLTDEEIDICVKIVKKACIGEEYDDILKPPSVEEQVEGFLKDFYEDVDSPLETKNYMEEFFNDISFNEDDK